METTTSSTTTSTATQTSSTTSTTTSQLPSTESSPTTSTTTPTTTTPTTTSTTSTTTTTISRTTTTQGTPDNTGVIVGAVIGTLVVTVLLVVVVILLYRRKRKSGCSGTNGVLCLGVRTTSFPNNLPSAKELDNIITPTASTYDRAPPSLADLKSGAGGASPGIDQRPPSYRTVTSARESESTTARLSQLEEEHEAIPRNPTYGNLPKVDAPGPNRSFAELNRDPTYGNLPKYDIPQWVHTIPSRAWERKNSAAVLFALGDAPTLPNQKSTFDNRRGSEKSSNSVQFYDSPSSNACLVEEDQFYMSPDELRTAVKAGQYRATNSGYVAKPSNRRVDSGTPLKGESAASLANVTDDVSMTMSRTDSDTYSATGMINPVFEPDETAPTPVGHRTKKKDNYMNMQLGSQYKTSGKTDKGEARSGKDTLASISEYRQASKEEEIYMNMKAMHGMRRKESYPGDLLLPAAYTKQLAQFSM